MNDTFLGLLLHIFQCLKMNKVSIREKKERKKVLTFFIGGPAAVVL